MLTPAKGEEGTARLSHEFARLAAPELLEHFRTREHPKFLPGFDDAGNEGASVSAPRAGFAEKFNVETFAEKFEAETAALVGEAEEIVSAGRWPLLGYGALAFSESPDWARDPVSGARWPLEYHADLRLVRDEAEGLGGDVRVLWELNRLGHFLTLGRGVQCERDERFSEELLRQPRTGARTIRSVRPNWSCAMEWRCAPRTCSPLPTRPPLAASRRVAARAAALDVRRARRAHPSQPRILLHRDEQPLSL